MYSYRFVFLCNTTLVKKTYTKMYLKCIYFIFTDKLKLADINIIM